MSTFGAQTWSQKPKLHGTIRIGATCAFFCGVGGTLWRRIRLLSWKTWRVERDRNSLRAHRRSRTSQFHQRLRNIAHTDQSHLIQTIDTDAEVHVMQTICKTKEKSKTSPTFNNIRTSTSKTVAKSDVAESDKRDMSWI